MTRGVRLCSCVPLWQDAFRALHRVVGGRVGDINAYVRYCGAADEVLPPEGLPKVGRQATRLLQLLTCTAEVDSGGGGEEEQLGEVDVCRPRWTPRQV